VVTWSSSSMGNSSDIDIQIREFDFFVLVLRIRTPQLNHNIQRLLVVLAPRALALQGPKLPQPGRARNENRQRRLAAFVLVVRGALLAVRGVLEPLDVDEEVEFFVQGIGGGYLGAHDVGEGALELDLQVLAEGAEGEDAVVPGEARVRALVDLCVGLFFFFFVFF
jgi:hypothetical protein